MKVWGAIWNSTKLLMLNNKDSLYIKFTWIWATTARVHTIYFCCIIDADGGVWSAVPPALEKPFSVFRELILTPLSHRDIYRPLDFFSGPLGAGWKRPSPLGYFSMEWALKTWEGCGSWKECGGVPKLAVQTVITPPVLPPFFLCISLSLNFSYICFIGLTWKAIVAKTTK